MTPPPAVRGGTPVDAAVLFATARAGDGGAAALLPFADGTLVGRLAAQLATLGVSRTVVITRPAWEADVRAALGEDAEVVSSPDVVADLGLVAELAGAAGDRGLLLANGDIATHREALAGLLADPRMATGILGGGRLRPMVFRIRGRRGRVISAGSAYHAVHRPTATFLGLLKVTPGDRPALARAAEQLAPLCAEPPAAWLEELDRKAASWRVRLAAGDAADADADEVVESPDDEGERARGGAGRRRRRAVARGRGTPARPARDGARRRRRAAAGRARARRRAHLDEQPPPAVLEPAPVRRVRRRGRARDRGDRRGPRPARLGGQGRRRLLHDVLRQHVLAGTSRAGARTAASRRTR